MAKQILHLVFGGELTALDKVEFKDLNKVHFVGLFPNFSKAKEAWKSAAQATVDNAHMRYFVVHLHRLLQPEVLPEIDGVKPRRRKAAAQKEKKLPGNAGKGRAAK